MLSGVFWDFNIMPENFQAIGKLMPTRWVCICLENLQQTNDLDSINIYIYAMLILSIILFIISFVKLKKTKFKTVFAKSGNTKNQDTGGFFDPNPKGTSSDPFTISLVVDLKNEKTYSGNRAVIFEEVFHAAQNDYALDKQYSLTSVQKEVEEKLVKNIEGVAKNEKGFSYEYMEFEGRDEIFGALKKGKKLTSDQRNKLQNAIYDLEASIRSVPGYKEKMKNEYFYAGTDLKFAEELYGQKLTNETEGVTVTGDGK